MSLRRRLVCLLLLVLVLVLALPALTVLALRWVDPPMSAFMLRAQANGAILYQWVDLGAIAPALPLAVVAAEDQTFPGHHGFVWVSIGNAIEERLDGGRMRGASSITQQVAKNLFLWPAQSYWRKSIEAYLTVWIELLWPKRRILEVYVNIAQFGPATFGAQAAADRFFGRPPAALSRSQAALLAAVLPAPQSYRVNNPSGHVRQRQAWILAQMTQLGSAHLDTILAAGR